MLGGVDSIGGPVSGLCGGKQRNKRLDRETMAIL